MFIKKRIKNIKKFHRKVVCILKKKKNNFFATTLKDNSKDVIFSKSCGMLAGIKGSKKYTTVAVETLGKEIFLRLFALGYNKRFLMELVLTFRVNKFVRAYVRGLMLYGKKYMNVFIKSNLLLSHNGLKSRKQRRV